MYPPSPTSGLRVFLNYFIITEDDGHSKSGTRNKASLKPFLPGPQAAFAPTRSEGSRENTQALFLYID